MVAGLTSGDGYTLKNTLSVFSASLVLYSDEYSECVFCFTCVSDEYSECVFCFTCVSDESSECVFCFTCVSDESSECVFCFTCVSDESSECVFCFTCVSDESSECVFCFTCVSAFKEKKLLVLHVHKVMTDSLNLVDCTNDSVGSSEHHLSVFGKFC